MFDLVMNMDRLSWKTIPEPLLIRVLGFLTVPDIANASAVCHRFVIACAFSPMRVGWGR